jgi:hypothetical protein
MKKRTTTKKKMDQLVRNVTQEERKLEREMARVRKEVLEEEEVEDVDVDVDVEAVKVQRPRTVLSKVRTDSIPSHWSAFLITLDDAARYS